MCEPLLPIDALNNLKWAVQSLVNLHKAGTWEKEIAENATREIVARIDWIRAQLAAAGEGRKNMGAQERKPSND